MRIFILEDDSPLATALVSVIRTYFREELATIETARTLQQAREVLPIFQPDILIFDVKLPDGHGFEVLQYLPNPTIGKICFSGLPERELIRDIARYGVQRFVSKPLETKELVQELREVMLEVRQAQQAAFLQQAQENRQDATDEENKRLRARLVEGDESPIIEIETDGALIRLQVSQILFCEAEKNYVNIHCEGRPEAVRVRKTLNEYDGILQQYGFIRTHKSFLVQMRKVIRLEQSVAHFADGRKARIAEGRRAEVKKVFAQTRI